MHAGDNLAAPVGIGERERDVADVVEEEAENVARALEREGRAEATARSPAEAVRPVRERAAVHAQPAGEEQEESRALTPLAGCEV
eukprot:8293058-Alexandrium_andersonii.AAC.1